VGWKGSGAVVGTGQGRKCLLDRSVGSMFVRCISDLFPVISWGLELATGLYTHMSVIHHSDSAYTSG